MDDKFDSPAALEKAPRGNRTPDASDTDSILFLKKNKPNLKPKKPEDTPISPDLPPSRFPHIYEDVPRAVLEKNRKLVASQETDKLASVKPSPANASAGEDSTQDSPQEFVEPVRDVSVFWNQPQLSVSGVLYEFPVHRSPPTKTDVMSPTYDIPPGLTKQVSLSDSEYDNVAFKTPPSYEVPPPPVPVSTPDALKPNKPAEDESPKAETILNADSVSPSSAHFLYEVPKPFARPCISPPESAFLFSDPSDLYDIPPQRTDAPSLGTSPKDADFMDALDIFSSDYLNSDFLPLLSPPPSYPPPPPPEPEPPEIPPRNSPAIPFLTSKEFQSPEIPVPAVRTSLARRTQVNRQLKSSTPQLSEEEAKASPTLSRTGSTFYRALVPTQRPVPAAFATTSEQSPTLSVRSASSLKSHNSMPDSPPSQPDDFFELRAFADSSDHCPPVQDRSGTTSDTSSLQSEDCWTVGKLDFSGYVYKAGSNRKAFQKCWCTLNDGGWSYYASEKDTIPLGTLAPQDIGAVFIVAGNEPSPATSVVPNLWCFEVQSLQSQGSRPLVLGVPTLPERREWLERLARLVVPPTSSGLSARQLHGAPKHAGRLHVKEGTSGFWQTAGVVLRGRSLGVHLPGSGEHVDLRRVMSVGKVTADQTYLTFGGAQERGPSFQVRLPGRVLYLQADNPRHTEAWLTSVTAAWQMPPDAPLSEQYVSQEGTPVAVDRCINFISTHGTLLTGIYRLAGSSSKIKKLVEQMLHNPWDLHLTTEDYSPHDVSNALKRYLRSFKDCLLTDSLFNDWIQSSKCQNPTERRKIVKNLLNELPTPNYLLLKKLVSHLKSISDHSEKNFMPVLNLAPVFGPSVLYKMVGSSTEEESCSTTLCFEENNASMDVVADLISGYSWFFEVDQAEMEKEKRIQAAMDLLREAKIAQRPAGDILVGVYVYSRDWGHCINVKLSPSMTAGALCKHTMQQLNIKEPINKMAVFEVVCEQDLERPLHHSEPVLSVVVRWANWDSSFAKSNFLCIKNNYVYDEIAPLVSNRQPLSVFSELRFAEARQKSFKKSVFEFTGGKITQYKDSKASQLLNQWNIEDVLWFMGCESRRSPPSKWNFTFVMRQGDIKRTRDRPYFGNCVSLATQEEFEKWLAAMLNAEFPKGIFPPPPEPMPDLLG